MDSYVRISLVGLGNQQQMRLCALLRDPDLKSLLEIVSAQLALDLLCSTLRTELAAITVHDCIRTGTVHADVVQWLQLEAAYFRSCLEKAGTVINGRHLAFREKIRQWNEYPPDRPNRAWNMQQTKNYINGMLKHGTGQWTEINEEYLVADCLTNVQVKDKHRSLEGIAARGEAVRNRGEVTDEMVVSFKIANSLGYPVPDCVPPPVIEVNNTVKQFLQQNGLAEDNVRRVCCFMRRPAVHDYLVKGRSHFAAGLLFQALELLQGGQLIEGNLSLKRDCDALKGMLDDLESARDTAGIALLKCFAAIYYYDLVVLPAEQDRDDGGDNQGHL